MAFDADIRKWLGGDVDLDSLVREQEEQTERMQVFEQRMAETVTTVRSSDRLISVTVTGSGSVTGLTIDPSAFDELDHGRIAPLILSTIHKAAQQTGAQLREGLTEVLGDEAFVDDLMSGWPAADEADGRDERDQQSEAERLLGYGVRDD